MRNTGPDNDDDQPAAPPDWKSGIPLAIALVLFELVSRLIFGSFAISLTLSAIVLAIYLVAKRNSQR